MEKRAFIAILISMIIILLYPYYLKWVGYEPRVVSNQEMNHNISVKKLDDTVSKNDTVEFTSETKNDTVNDTVIENKRLKIDINLDNGAILGVDYKEPSGEKTIYSLKYKGLGLLTPTVSTVSFSPFIHDTVIKFKKEKGVI